ncbi:MAG: GNAT family N-acetyltransferase [Alphaproteobacteria bacterium]|nr:GNAT family N-acetyltransferase [Alphaproteobacteria bacterium]
MSDFFGNAAQITLQRRIRDRADRIAAAPVLANGGRLMVVVDPDKLGWDEVRALAEEDGVLGLGPGSYAQLAQGISRTFSGGWDWPHWECWSADWPTVEAATSATIAARLPHGWQIEAATHPDPTTIAAAQALAEACGVAPLPGYYLAGHDIDSVLVTIRDAGGRVLATAHGDMRYHPDSPMGGTLWAGVVAVDPTARSGGLGRRANAEALRAAQNAFGWTRVVEFARPANILSSRVIRSCGMALHGDWCVFVVTPRGMEFTR